MQSISIYKPIQFFLITFLITWIPWFIAAYLSYQKGRDKFQMLGMLLGLFAPFAVAFVMIYTSKSQELVQDFWNRLFLYKIQWSTLLVLFIAIPAAFFLATTLSLLFGKSIEQFKVASEFNVMKGWQIFSLVLPIFLAPTLEELGWRGYGVDSLKVYFNLFYASLLFGTLWALWHLPLFFIKGSYHHSLWNLNIAYVINFFISIIPAAFLINWIYYKNSRSILIAILAHSMLNMLSVIFKTEQLTKCLFTILLFVISTVVVIKDKDFFFLADN